MPETLRIGVLLLPPIQLLDIAPVDLFSMTSKEYLTLCGLPSPITNLGLEVSITYICPDSSLKMAECTASAAMRVNASLDSKSVAPGTLDILLIPGPPPDSKPDEDSKAFLRAHAEYQKATVMTVCTGIYLGGYAGILDGKNVTGPRALVPQLKKLFPQATFEDKRWVVDGNIWSSGGITNGQDMVAAYLRQKWPGPMTDMVCAMADVGDRGQEYGSSKASESVWVVWQIIRAFFRSK